MHGWPDSFSLWHFQLKSQVLQDDCTIVAVDLPGFGGSDSFPPYQPNNVLEALAEFTIGMRELYNIDDDVDSGHGQSPTNSSQSKVYVCGHDWGCILGYRLAAEAPALADRFILTNGPHVCLLLASMGTGMLTSTTARTFSCKRAQGDFVVMENVSRLHYCTH